MLRTANPGTLFRTFKEALFAYLFDIGGMAAGFIVASQLDMFRLSPWIIAMYPAILSSRGVISGLFSGRLSTALHIGTIYPRIFKNTKSFYKLFLAIIVITLEASIAMILASFAFGGLFWGITAENFLEILAVVLATMALGELTLSLITVGIAFLTFKHGLDPDIVVYPILSTVADIAITLCYALMLNVFFSGPIGRLIVVLPGASLIVLASYILSKNIHEEEFIKTIKESSLTLMLVAIIVNVTGTALHGVHALLEKGNGKEIYTVYPALIDTVGGVGSVVGSTATTRLALGLLKPSFFAIREHTAQISGAWGASIIMFILYSALSLLVHGMFGLHAFLALASILLVTNVITVAFLVLISYAVSILTFMKGLDPDNFVIPIESSLADSMTTFALFAALLLLS